MIKLVIPFILMALLVAGCTSEQTVTPTTPKPASITPTPESGPATKAVLPGQATTAPAQPKPATSPVTSIIASKPGAKPSATAPVTGIAPVPVAAPTTNSAPAAPGDASSRLTTIEKDWPGVLATKLNLENNYIPKINSHETRIKQLEAEMDRLKGLAGVGVNSGNNIVRDNVSIRIVNQQSYINNRVSGTASTASFQFRVYNQAGYKITKVNIIGCIQISPSVLNLATGYPQLRDNVDPGIIYNPTFDGAGNMYFDIHSFASASTLSLDNNGAWTFSPVLSVVSNSSSSQAYSFKLVITQFYFEKA